MGKNMTEQQAIIECKALWSDIAKSGMSKTGFLFCTGKGQAWRAKKYCHDCPLCEFIGLVREEGCLPRCQDCPLVKKYNENCSDLGYYGHTLPLLQWLQAIRNL